MSWLISCCKLHLRRLDERFDDEMGSSKKVWEFIAWTARWMFLGCFEYVVSNKSLSKSNHSSHARNFACLVKSSSLGILGLYVWDSRIVMRYYWISSTVLNHACMINTPLTNQVP